MRHITRLFFPAISLDSFSPCCLCPNVFAFCGTSDPVRVAPYVKSQPKQLQVHSQLAHTSSCEFTGSGLPTSGEAELPLVDDCVFWLPEIEMNHVTKYALTEPFERCLCRAHLLYFSWSTVQLPFVARQCPYVADKTGIALRNTTLIVLHNSKLR
jgi:hypothetical protein